MIPSREGGDQLRYSTILTFAQLPERNREFGRFDMGKSDCDERRNDPGFRIPPGRPGGIKHSQEQPCLLALVIVVVEGLSPTIGNSSRDVDKSLRIKGLHLDGLAKMLRGTGLVGDRASFSGCRLAWPPVTPHLRQPRISRDRIRLGIETAPLGWLLVSRIVAGNNRARALTGIR